MQFFRYCRALKHGHTYYNFQTVFRSNISRSFSICKANNIAITDNKNDNMVQNFLKRTNLFDFTSTKLKVSGYFLYESIADNISYLDFFKKYKLADTFYSWFVVTELHIWMLSVRAMAEGTNGRTVRNAMIEAMWTDIQTRVKKLEGANSSDIKDQVNELAKQFNAALIGYDEGLLSEDDKVLAGALWRRFFQRNCESAQDLENLVHYVRKQVNLFDSMSTEDIMVKRKIRWEET